MTPAAKEVYEKVVALRQLQRSTGTVTNRAQKHLLITLSDDDLPVVAKALQNEATIAALSGEKVGR